MADILNIAQLRRRMSEAGMGEEYLYHLSALGILEELPTDYGRWRRFQLLCPIPPRLEVESRLVATHTQPAGRWLDETSRTFRELALEMEGWIASTPYNLRARGKVEEMAHLVDRLEQLATVHVPDSLQSIAVFHLVDWALTRQERFDAALRCLESVARVMEKREYYETAGYLSEIVDEARSITFPTCRG